MDMSDREAAAAALSGSRYTQGSGGAGVSDPRFSRDHEPMPFGGGETVGDHIARVEATASDSWRPLVRENTYTYLDSE